MRSLVWFRSDLRVADNTALHRAAAWSTRGVIGAFLLAPSQWLDHHWAPARVDLLLRQLADLSSQLAALNIPLLIAAAGRFDQAPAAILRLARSHACDAIHFNIEYEVNESRRDDAVARAATKAGLAVHSHHDQVVFPPDSIRTGQGKFYTVFTPYKKTWLEKAAAAGVTPLPPPRRQDPTGIQPDAIPAALPEFVPAIPGELWPASERHAQHRLQTFIDTALADYADHRNAPALAATSALSPYLAIGAISPRQCIAAAAEANRGTLNGAATGAATWIAELIWREFYRHILVGFPRVCMNRPFKLQTERLRWSRDPAAFTAWCHGRTGYPIVDAGMRQLRRTGWMHNRARMIVAMFLTKHLFHDWRDGERFFMQHLVDGDFASNNGGWQWSASTGNDAAPYFRIFNPTSQSKAHDPQGRFIRQHVPELAPLDTTDIHDPPPLARGSLGYPMPIVDHHAARQHALSAFKSLD